MYGRGRAGQKAREQLGVKDKDRLVLAANIHAEQYDPDKLDTFPDFLRDSVRADWNKPRAEIAYESFRDGAKWAMEEGHAELIEENYELHGRIMQLCDKFLVKPCPTCNTEGLKNPPDDLEPCETCNGDCWIPNVTG